MISQILDKVISISDLNRVRQDLAHGFSKPIGPIPADNLNFGMGGKPGFHRFGSPIWQKIQGLACLSVDEDGSTSTLVRLDIYVQYPLEQNLAQLTGRWSTKRTIFVFRGTSLLGEAFVHTFLHLVAQIGRSPQ